ncbi:MAG TPA: proton-conducting transporter membrane subunit [Acidimicrobiales bacterium]|jgi:hydrogenase-4 component F
MPTLALLVPLFPLVCAALIAAAGWRRPTAWLGPVSAAATLAAGIVLAVHILDDDPVTALGDLVRIDALSAFMIIVIGLVALIATTYGVTFIDGELRVGDTTAVKARRYGILVELFLAAMLGAVVADNLGALWVAIEATTVATAFLINHRGTPASLEASWKYILIGSVGVALAFLGTILVYFASHHSGGAAGGTLSWSRLTDQASGLDPGVMRLAVGLLVLGYGTKVGLAPLHTALPDAYSQAPAPVSALMSGALLPVAFYALLRYKTIADAALGPDYMRGLLLAGALLSLGVAASLLIAQRDYRRLLAYSSIEHMGVVVLGAAIGSPLAMAATLLHVLGHGMGKAVLFCSSGEILRTDGGSEIGAVRGLLVRKPVVGAAFGFGLLALLGLPPFSLFASELGIARAGFDEGLGWAVTLALVLTLAIFAVILGHAERMLLGEPDAEQSRDPVRRMAALPLVGGLVTLAVLGISIWPIQRLLVAAAAVITG